MGGAGCRCRCAGDGCGKGGVKGMDVHVCERECERTNKIGCPFCDSICSIRDRWKIVCVRIFH